MPSEAQILLEAVLQQIATAALIIFTLWPLTLVNWLYVYAVPCIISSASHSKLLRLMWCSYVNGNPAQRQFGLVSWILSARAQTEALTGMLKSKIFLGHQLSGRHFHVFSLFYLEENCLLGGMISPSSVLSSFGMMSFCKAFHEFLPLKPGDWYSPGKGATFSMTGMDQRALGRLSLRSALVLLWPSVDSLDTDLKLELGRN